MKPVENLDQLDAMIVEEKHNVASEFLKDAWQDAVSEGIETMIIARSAVRLALATLIESDGEKSADRLTREVLEWLETGALLPDRSLH